MYIDKQATLDALHFQPDAKILKNPVVACLFALCVTWEWDVIQTPEQCVRGT